MMLLYVPKMWLECKNFDCEVTENEKLKLRSENEQISKENLHDKLSQT